MICSRARRFDGALLCLVRLWRAVRSTPLWPYGPSLPARRRLLQKVHPARWLGFSLLANARRDARRVERSKSDRAPQAHYSGNDLPHNTLFSGAFKRYGQYKRTPSAAARIHPL